MRPLRGALRIALLMAWAMAGSAAASFNGPPAITVFPDDYPADVSFFFPAGGPLERFTGRPGVWYAIYRAPLYPGRPYDLILEHKGDPERLKIFALDNHPFDKVTVKSEILLRKIDGWADSSDAAYVARIILPRDASVYGIYLLLEWMSPPGKDGPLPVTMQVLSWDPRPQTGEGRMWSLPWVDKSVKSPLQSQNGNPHEIPVPRRVPPGEGSGGWIEKEHGK
ncbi:MAG TPA: hypothetical protein VFF01_05820 [Candidatus Deferrimicrobiaceae bacterium]|nr:hypothetical protein [Candidatus Deferrimicrobiaceae bacterium]